MILLNNLICYNIQQYSIMSTNFTYLSFYFYLAYFLDILNSIHLLLGISFLTLHC